MTDNRFDQLGDDNGHEDEAIAQLSQLARAHGAESRAADIVSEKALIGRYRFSPALRWMEWDGRRWDADDVAEPRVVETVRQFIDTTEREYRAQYVEATAALDTLTSGIIGRAAEGDTKDSNGKALKTEAIIGKVATGDEAAEWNKAVQAAETAKRQADMWLNLLSAGKIGAITKLCRGMDGIVTRSTDFDTHPDLLNCHNGVVDLRNGELMPHDPDLLITHLAGGDYNPEAKSALWDKALQAVQPEIREWFQIRMGQSITGHTPDDDTLIVNAGGGENGKSAVLSAIMRACGTYGRLISHRVLIAQPGQHPTELMDLRGLRFALLEETPEEGRLDTHQLKTTIGTPQITARRMRRDDVTFNTSHTLWVNTNFLPQVDTTDHGTWRRLKAMPWPYTYVKPREDGTFALKGSNDRRGDLTLKPKLATNPTVPVAVLAWLVEGAKVWYSNEQVSPDDPAEVVEATSSWRQTSDVGYQFAVQRLIADKTRFILAEVMRQEFSEFLQQQGKREWSAQLLNQRLGASMLAAGISVDKDPTKAAKVREGDEVSTMKNTAWGQRTIHTGDTVRMWRGVRFRTAEDDKADRERERGLKAV